MKKVRIYIENSTFSENKAKYLTNCIYFVGNDFISRSKKYSILFLIKLDSNFMDNVPIIDQKIYDYFNSPEFKKIFSTITRVLEITGGNGGVFWLESANITIFNCSFINNQAYIGGVGFFVRHPQIDMSRIIVKSSIFYANLAGPTSDVFNFGAFRGIIIEISNCNFTGNMGKRL